jgi:hypothetical protein
MTIHSNFEQTEASPVINAFFKWRERYEWVNSSATRGMDEDEFNALCDELRDLRNAVICQPSEGPADTLAKLVAFNENGQDILYSDIACEHVFLSETRAVMDLLVKQ